MSGVLPEVLADKTSAEIAALNVRLDGMPIALGDLFKVTGGEGNTLLICSDCRRLDYLGRGMTCGTMRIEGNAGNYSGQLMLGGELIIEGSTGDFAANGMRGGMMRVLGNAGDRLGAALIGDRTGMAGGVVAIAGNTGDRLGDRMRRGLILVGGKAGNACGASMLAGTIVVSGGCGSQTGFGLRRGSLILGQMPDSIPATFNESGAVELTFLRLLQRHARSILPGAIADVSGARRFMGDFAFGGKGEILVLA